MQQQQQQQQQQQKGLNCMASVCERTISNEQSPLLGEVNANFCG
jgi:hypothetical protein